MDIYRKTYAEIDLKAIISNIEKIVKKYDEYKYRFAVVKADAYGRGIVEVSKAVVKGGCNYLAVATLEEGLKIRKEINDVPILCLGVVHAEYLNKCAENNIAVTINSLEYLKLFLKENIRNIKVHIKINTGMNRLGISDEKEFNEVYNLLKEKNVCIEGIYTHIYDASDKESYFKQIEAFKRMLDSKKEAYSLPIIHISASEALEKYPKLEYANGYRLGKIMYGFSSIEGFELESTFKLYSEVIQINKLKKGDTLGYNANYTANGDVLIAVIPIGYEDGVVRKNKGRYVYINNKKYDIVGDICMDMLFVKIDNSVNLYDKVEIIKNNEHIEYIANYLDTIPSEVTCLISKRVPRVYIK